MIKQFVASMLVVSSCIAAPSAYGVELVLTGRATTMAFLDAAFKRDGKYDLIRPSKCSYTYLERPEVGFANDRVSIRVHLSARAAQEIGGQCVGGGEAFWLTLSATPFVEGATVGVKDPKVVQLDNPSYRALLEAALQQGLVNGLRHDVGASLQAALAKDVNHYRLTINNLSITNLRVRDNVLRATIDLELAGDVAQ